MQHHEIVLVADTDLGRPAVMQGAIPVALLRGLQMHRGRPGPISGVQAIGEKHQGLSLPYPNSVQVSQAPQIPQRPMIDSGRGYSRGGYLYRGYVPSMSPARLRASTSGISGVERRCSWPWAQTA